MWSMKTPTPPPPPIPANPFSSSMWTSSTTTTHNGSLTMSAAGSRSILSINATDGGDAIIKTNKHEINLDKMYEIVQLLSERLMIIVEDPAILEKYPTLKDTYDQYKVLSALMLNDKEKDNASV